MMTNGSLMDDLGVDQQLPSVPQKRMCNLKQNSHIWNSLETFFEETSSTVLQSLKKDVLRVIIKKSLS